MFCYLVTLLTIFHMNVPVSPFLLKCETVPENDFNETHLEELVDTVAIDDGAVISTYDDYNITSVGIHKIHKIGESWNSARNICLDEKAQLAVINTEDEEALIIKYMKDHNINAMWIGVHNLFDRSQWTTVTGERLYSLDYVHWSKDEPNNVGSNEHCVDISQTGMNDLSCTVKLYFICERMKLA